MCRAPIGKVVRTGSGTLTVECKDGKAKELRSRLADVKEGDYVLFSSGIAIDKVDKEEAEFITGGLQ